MSGRRLLAGVCWAGAVAMAARGTAGSWNTARSLAWLQDGQRRPVGGGVPLHVVVILPMLREQRIIAEALRYFAKLAEACPAAVSLAVVTTAREHAERGRFPEVRSTNELAADLVAELRAAGVAARHYDYPDPGGTMAHQVNYAAHGEIHHLAAAGVPQEQVWVALYNADSRPHPDTIAALAARVSGDEQVRVVQQSAIFTANVPQLLAQGRLVAAGAGLLQTRWTLAREIPRLRRQARHARHGSRWPHLAHCVGHGLFIRADEFTARGGLPVQTMNEDLAFGYLACAAGTPIEALPLLELAETPASVPALVRQGRQWFWSYPEYPAFAGLAARQGLGTRWRRAGLTVQGLARGGLWLSQSPAVAAALALPLLDRRRGAVAASAAALILYAAVPLALMAAHPATRTHVPWSAQALVGMLGAAVTSSAGPWWCCVSAADRAVRGTTYRHDKTER
ncbi:glycosyltransferase family 2 protein [Nonomuraea sp. NPDC026600]|uniref:glycosyltransferase family 2 protein n=1 Tax=Nonomuraea sp. NPDC026600 TaxID=3155363 RepID=UPI0033CD031A